MKTQKNNLIDVYIYYYTKDRSWYKTEEDKKRLRKEIFDVFQTEAGALVAVKECGSLETEFWIGEGHGAGQTLKEAQKLCRDIDNNKAAYFIEENLKGIDNTLQTLEEYIRFLKREVTGICGGDIFCTYNNYNVSANNPIREIGNRRYYENRQGEEITLKDALAYKDILIRQRAKQEKRCQAYLKRFGIKKIHSKTYWADR